MVKNLPANAGDVCSIPVLGKIPWSMKWQPSLVFLPGKPHGQRSLVGYSPWCHKELDTTEGLSTHNQDNTVVLRFPGRHEVSCSSSLE